MNRYADLLKDKLTHCSTREQLFKAIVDAPFDFPIEAAKLYLGIVVLLQANTKTQMIDRVALSNTELAKGTTDISVKKFEDIKIPLDHRENIIALAINKNEPQETADWQYLFTPALTPEEARLNQAAGAVAYSAVYPLTGGRTNGALIFSYYQYPENIGRQQHEFMQAYAGIVAERLNNFAA
jgi:hypothetical protein